MSRAYTIEFDNNAKKEFKKLDTPIQKQILLWLHKNIQRTANPRWTGKALTADKQGLWRYRIGKYRVICHIKDDIALVLVVKSGKREIVYDF